MPKPAELWNMKKFFLVACCVLVGLVVAWWFWPKAPDLLRNSALRFMAEGAAIKKAVSTAAKRLFSEERQRPILQGQDGQEWVEPITGMTFVWIPGGCFRMGSEASEQGRDRDEGPSHEVCLDGFWMGQKEVTRGEFRRFVEDAGYVTEAEKEGFSWVYTGTWEKRGGYSWRRPGFYQDDTHPVVHVSYNDALAMAKWLGEKAQASIGLPTEAQWEYACRSGRLAARYWGDDAHEACAYANAADRTAAKDFPSWTVHDCYDGFVFTAPAGTYRPNAYRLQDMLGNVWEWCADGYDPQAYRRHGPKNPAVLDAGVTARVIRGGSWYSRPDHVRCAKRDALSRPDRRSQDLGIRLIRQ
ncbi:MAG: formylglycine-generating enzyme family protein [Desulfosoma sp.]|uniref:formylglycine-generating enzyme family protein n=2 Tax=Desulfosoma sp. TaxID=2603217 RepID=UPI00404AA8DD